MVVYMHVIQVPPSFFLSRRHDRNVSLSGSPFFFQRANHLIDYRNTAGTVVALLQYWYVVTVENACHLILRRGCSPTLTY